MENIRVDFQCNGRSLDLDEMDILMLKVRESAGLQSINIFEAEDLARRNDEVRQFLATVRQRAQAQDKKSCVFCKKNGENRGVYSTHSVKDEMGRVTCPILQNYKCPACGATGKKAHTIKYCPQKYMNQHAPIVVMNNNLLRSASHGMCHNRHGVIGRHG